MPDIAYVYTEDTVKPKTIINTLLNPTLHWDYPHIDYPADVNTRYEYISPTNTLSAERFPTI